MKIFKQITHTKAKITDVKNIENYNREKLKVPVKSMNRNTSEKIDMMSKCDGGRQKPLNHNLRW